MSVQCLTKLGVQNVEPPVWLWMEDAPCALAAIRDGYVVFANSLFRELAGMPSS